uniref:Sodium/potassium/calcium exchanger Nckx30C n=1 Tax=Steinernema glaseri TaxID=37863 RepID=A0A1I7ZVH2_9BILA
MAAGGSAPEFFTSVFGVFITQNNVGIGTIVGSATFNILCVLAFCTLFSTTMLQLTWWPLFRDMSFYIVALFLLVVFFLDEKIVWQESLALLLLYCIYAVVMKYNVQLEHWVKRHVVRKTACSTVSSSTVMAANGANGVNGVNGANGGAISTVSGGTYKSEHRRSIPVLHAGTMFRTGLVHMALDESPEDMHHHHHHQRQQNGARPERSSRLGMHDTPGANGLPPMNNSLHGLEAQTLAKTNGNANGFAHPVPQRAATVPSMSSSSSEPEKPVDISWPQSPLAQMLYVVLVPIVFPLYFTLPDVKKPSARKYVVVTFIGSVLWIACYSYLMVWWANTIGETLRIPNEIMGLTVLAAGTSIPDLITSVIVARKGLGDMAVSSSIGSNMFDICVGLPVPWLIHFGVGFLRTGMTPLFISVSSNGLLCSVGMLFLMLIVLVVSIAVTDWRMNKSFGVLMILAYVVFCIFSVLLEMGHVVCPLRPVGLAC